MDWIKQLNKAMAYIEEHLTDEIEYEVSDGELQSGATAN